MTARIAIVAITTVLTACSPLIPQASREPPIQITRVELRRSETERYRYELTLGIHNESTDRLKSIEFRAILEASVPDRDEAVREEIVLAISDEIPGRSWHTLHCPFDSPFAFVAPVPVRLTGITVCAFGGSVRYPWPIEEEL